MFLPLRRVLFGLPLLILVGCSSSNTAPPADTVPQVSTNAALFDPTTSTIPLPNILATATAADPLTGAYTDHTTGQTVAGARPPNTSMLPPEALAYVNKYEMGSTNAVSGLNAPIYIRFSYPLDASTVNAANIKVFQITPDASGLENSPLTFADVTGMFTFGQDTAGHPYSTGTDVFLVPNFPLLPGTRYLYVVSNRVKDAATGGAVISSVYFEYLKSPAPLTGSTAALEPIRANAMSGSNILLSGYAKVMDDLIAASATTSISSRSGIALMGRFITTGAGFIPPDPANANPAIASSRIPMESALRSFAAGTTLGGLTGKTWSNTITVLSTFTKDDADPTKTVAAYWQGATAKAVGNGEALSPGIPPATLGQIVVGTFNCAFLSMDPVVVRSTPATMDISTTGGYNPAAGVLVPFRSATGLLTGFYHKSTPMPFVYCAPDAAAPAGGYPLVLFQVGLDKSKDWVLNLTDSLTRAGFAVLAIDLPMHGDLAAPGHKKGQWGQDFIALGAPLATRTNLQQIAFNLNRLELTVRAGGFLALGAKAPSMAKISFVGHSTGNFGGAGYLAGNTTLSTTGYPYTQTTLNNDMKGFMSSNGGRLAYLLQNSPSYGPAAAAGLQQLLGIPPGSPTFHGFFLVTQAVVDPADPASFTTPLAAGLPSRLSGRIAQQEVVGAGEDTIPAANARYFGNAVGGREVLGTAGSAVAPGFKQLGYGGGTSPRIPAPFMFTLNGTTPAPKVAFAALTATATSPNEGYFQFDQAGAVHSLLVDPIAANLPALLLAQKQMVYFLGQTGTSIVVDPTQTGPSLPLALIPFKDEPPLSVMAIAGH